VLNHHLTGPQQLSLSLRLRILVDVLAGLQYAHDLTDYDGTALGVVHRDVNPHNVFITYDGHVKLMDFGVAKTVAAAYQTRPGAIKGKLAYLAPEYLRSDAVDRRADVFAVGVMLWELLAGRRLWHGMSEAQIVHQLAAAATAPALPPDAIRPPALDAICARALATNPADRYPTAAELEIDLQHVLAGAADSHARTLGRVVSHAFATARAEREALIARALETGRPPPTSPGYSKGAYWTKESDWTREVNWTREVDAFLAAADDMLDVTVVDPTIPPEPDPAPRRPAPPPPPPPRRRPRVVGGAIATVAISAAVLTLIASEMQRGAPPPSARSAATAAMAATQPAATPPAATAPPAAAPLPPPTPPEEAAATDPAGGQTAFPAFAARPTPPPPSLVAGEMSALRLHAEQISLGRDDSRTGVFERGDDRKASAGRRRRHDGPGRSEGDTSDAPAGDNLRPSGLRAIDEGDPYK
jgi:serine/threonine-protein kinase